MLIVLSITFGKSASMVWEVTVFTPISSVMVCVCKFGVAYNPTLYFVIDRTSRVSYRLMRVLCNPSTSDLRLKPHAEVVEMVEMVSPEIFCAVSALETK
jgi:hypothetical protein